LPQNSRLRLPAIADLPDGQISDCVVDAAASEEGPAERLNDCARELFRIFRILLDGPAE
jgi:hypothetical protein